MAKKKKKSGGGFLYALPVLVFVGVLIFALFNFQVLGFSETGLKVRQASDSDKTIVEQLTDVANIEKVTYVVSESDDSTTYAFYCYSETGGIMYLGESNYATFLTLGITFTLVGVEPVEHTQVSIVVLLIILAIGIAVPVVLRKFLYYR